MFRTQNFDDKTMDTRSEDDYDFCNAETSRNCVAKFTPPPEAKTCLRDRFMSPRWLSKSVPRRNRSVVQYKINRSLNFDIGRHRKIDCTTSSNTYVNNSPRNHLHLSRSAKILKALNIDYSPLKSGGYKKINKTLNFDLTPSPKRFSSANKSQSQMSNIRLTSSGINKTLNFDSSEDSSIPNSPHNTSIDSIDENQNQTPSQRNSKVKKSLSYISLSSNGSNTSVDFNLLSPSLRTELREKIDDIVQTSMSPDLQSMRRSPGHEKINCDNMIVSTPRNVVNDFSDDDEDRPETPKNAIRLIPESMSSIKKSHRKERISGRFMHRIQTHSMKPIEMETTEDEDQRPFTPLTSENQETSNYNLRSITKLHKKDKNRRNSCGYRSGDELSETGSLFDYSVLQDEMTDKNDNDEKVQIDLTKDPMSLKNTSKENPDDSTMQIHKQCVLDVENTTTAKISPTTGPTTPENRIDYLRRIMTDSIKKSHKKLKETNKKSLIKTRILQKQMNDVEVNEFSSPENDNITRNRVNKDNNCVVSPLPRAASTSNDANRSTTPENMNSSRLLLAQYSSVKKSHKKDKHRKMSFAQRHIVMTENEENNSPVNSKDQIFNKSSLINSDIPLITITEASTSKCTSSNSFSSISSDDKSEYCSLGTSPLEINDNIDIKSMVSSPNKRKSPQSDENGNADASTSFSNDSRVEYETAEDEFKIFTPIKKRKPLIILSHPKILNNNSCEMDTENLLSNGRCDTPKTGFNILTSDLKSDFVVSDDDKNKCSEQSTINNTENENGRLTPENNGRFERISALSSIKKSHKKDKWANARRRSIRTLKETSEKILECDRATNVCSNNLNPSINNWRQTRTLELSSDSGEKTESFDEEMSPKPSTSYSDAITQSDSSMKTPPNGLGAKTYLRLIQTTSIKRSHKKMREKKKIESIISDPNLSDDGSIFDETERSLNSSTIDHLRASEVDDNHEDFVPLDDSDVHETTEKIHYPHSCCGNRSNDGSIFGSDGEMNSPNKQ